jgi:acetyl-CoA carboxylase beta subunit
MLEHGMIDAVVARPELRDRMSLLLSYLTDKGCAPARPEAGEL